MKAWLNSDIGNYNISAKFIISN